jgi:cytochrome P450
LYLTGDSVNALSFTMYALAEHPDVDRRLREEIKNVVGDKPLTAQLLSELRYMEVRSPFCTCSACLCSV